MYMSFYLGVPTLHSCFPWLLSRVLRWCPGVPTASCFSCSASRSRIIVSFLIVDLGVEPAQNWDGGGFASPFFFFFFILVYHQLLLIRGMKDNAVLFLPTSHLAAASSGLRETEAIALAPAPPSFQIFPSLVAFVLGALPFHEVISCQRYGRGSRAVNPNPNPKPTVTLNLTLTTLTLNPIPQAPLCQLLLLFSKSYQNFRFPVVLGARHFQKCHVSPVL